MTSRKHIQLHFDVATDDQAAELSAAWEEIVAGRRTRISPAAEDTNEIMERARTELEITVKAIEEHPGTGQNTATSQASRQRLQRQRISIRLEGHARRRRGVGERLHRLLGQALVLSPVDVPA